MAGSQARILVVDDDPAVGKVLCALLRQAGYDAQAVLSGDKGLTQMHLHAFDAVIADLRMPGLDGMELLDAITRSWPDVPVVMLTAHGSVAVAVEAMKRGAADFLTKPFDRQEILYVIDKTLALGRRHVESVPEAPPSRELVGDSPPMREVYRLVRRAAPGRATVLIRGETGTGKDLVARAIHRESPRREGPFVKVQCSGLPESLLESELFGYERGAFTGAAQRKPGRVELAQGGTLFLDEIGDLAPALQVKLLRVLEDRAFERLGGTQTVTADVRFVAATHRDLEALVASSEFREDLYYRLMVIPIETPPLRDRPGDVPLLASHFCQQLARAHHRPRIALSPTALERLQGLPWPGNVRQLRHLIERLVVLSDSPKLTADDVDRESARWGPHSAPDTASPGAAAGVPARPGSGGGAADTEAPLDASRRQAERAAILAALDRCGQNRTQAARVLGISRRTLYNKLHELDLL